MTGVEEQLIALAGLHEEDTQLRVALGVLASAADGGGDPTGDCLGTRNHRLLRLYQRLSTAPLEACAACPACGERSEFDVPVVDLLATPLADPACHIAIGEVRFRLPTMADVARLSRGGDALPVANQIAAMCRESGTGAIDDALVAALGSALDAADPLGDVTLGLDCVACAAHFPVTLDIALLVGDACIRIAEGLLRDIDMIASAYGWTEAEILDLPPERRRRYVAMIATRRTEGGARPRLAGVPA